MINSELRIPQTLARVTSPHVQGLTAQQPDAAGPSDAVTLSVPTPAIPSAAKPTRSFRGILLAGLLIPAAIGGALVPAMMQSARTDMPISQTVAVKTAQADTQAVRGDIVEDGDTWHVSPGTEKLVFGKDGVSTFDGAGKLTGKQEFKSHVVTTTIHGQADLAHHALLTQGPDGQIEVHLPPGTVRVQIEQAEAGKSNGAVYALDNEAHTLASEEHSDIHLVR